MGSVFKGHDAKDGQISQSLKQDDLGRNSALAHSFYLSPQGDSLWVILTIALHATVPEHSGHGSRRDRDRGHFPASLTLRTGKGGTGIPPDQDQDHRPPASSQQPQHPMPRGVPGFPAQPTGKMAPWHDGSALGQTVRQLIGEGGRRTKNWSLNKRPGLGTRWPSVTGVTLQGQEFSITFGPNLEQSHGLNTVRYSMHDACELTGIVHEPPVTA